MKDYHNTNNESGEGLRKSVDTSKRQNDIILEYFQLCPNDNFTPEEIWKRLFDENTPITSIRRSISNLTDEGKLFKTKEQRKGMYGKKIFAWKYYRAAPTLVSKAVQTPAIDTTLSKTFHKSPKAKTQKNDKQQTLF